ncbi:MAG: DNA repair protein RecN [Myxococcota bacterium]
MLTYLRVRHFAIIDELEVELGPGLNVVTGETGAGKSILVDALGLVLGGKGRSEVVRTGEKQAEVEALFDVADDPKVAARLRNAGMDAEGDELVVRRVVLANGRTRAYVNGRLATARQLAELAAGLADISSQHEHHTLVDPATHLLHLDAFGRLEGLRTSVGEAHDALARATAELEELEGRARDRFEREDLLRFQIAEIDELEPRPDEEEGLREERERLRHAERLAKAAGDAEDALYAADGSVSESLAQVAAEMDDAARIDPRLAPLAEQIEAARAQIEDAAAELGRYGRGVTVDEERLAEVEERLDRLERIRRKYGGSIEGVLAHRAQAREELESLEHHEERLEEARVARDGALEEARRRATELRERRQRAADSLGDAMSAELASLGMGGARVVVEVAPLQGGRGELEVGGARLSRTGIDRVEFLIAPNRGEQARPLRKVASGGELSRAMLAIRRVLAGLGPAGLYVFDEVDAGVGGAVAEVIGRKLRDVAAHHQVLCITHLPQIAVYADRHFRVSKEVDGGRTRSAVERLPEQERLEEVARMLGGLRVTRKTREAAAEMLRGARGGAAQGSATTRT